MDGGVCERRGSCHLEVFSLAAIDSRQPPHVHRLDAVGRWTHWNISHFRDFSDTRQPITAHSAQRAAIAISPATKVKVVGSSLRLSLDRFRKLDQAEGMQRVMLKS
jgi:hypothetical protein